MRAKAGAVGSPFLRTTLHPFWRQPNDPASADGAGGPGRRGPAGWRGDDWSAVAQTRARFLVRRVTLASEGATRRF